LSKISKYKTLSLANESFLKSEYDAALRHFAEVLHDYPDSKEAYNGAILAEMAMSGEDGAEALFDYYTVLKNENKDEADVVLSEILESIDGTLDQLKTIFSQPIKEKLEQENGILYGDFISLVKEDGDFKEVFENIMFSTKVIISEKEDFVDFLERLMNHGFKEMALTYLEGALSVYPNDSELRKLLKRLAKASSIENRAS
jgi:tetratricopeptide (TPR) repeat protein